MFVVAALSASAWPGTETGGLEARAAAIAASLAIVAGNHRLLVLHQGARALVAPAQLAPDLAAAASAGVVGHLLARELRNALPQRLVLALQANAVVPGVDAAERLRACPSRVVEVDYLRALVQQDAVLACVACVPVAVAADGCMAHSEAGLDGDAAAADLATELGADILVLLTDVDAVYADWPRARTRIAELDARAARQHHFDVGSIGAKIAAAQRFGATRGSFAAIGSATRAEALVAGSAGTRVAAA